jgi:hypothetical protein
VAGVGDVNGDGMADLAIGIQGQVMVFSGADGSRLRTLRVPRLPQGGANFGAVLAAVGDVNDDGIPDLAVGAPYQDMGECCNQGRVVVFSGADGTPLHTLQAPSLQGEANFGAALAAVGDVNDDGIPDLAVGVPWQDLVGRNCCDHGQVVVFSGADGTPLHTLQAPRPQAGAVFGFALAAVGDVNDDGIPDLAVGASGQVVVFSGADGTPFHTLRAPRPQADSVFGGILAGVGDVDGDDVPDLAVGLPGQDVGECCDHGQVVVFSGADGRRLRTLRAPRPQATAQFGAALANVGDVNGDSVPDLAVGAPTYDRGDLVDQGQVVVFSGATGHVLYTLHDRSPYAGGAFGSALARVGDVDGDDVPDLAVGAPAWDAGTCCYQGAVFLFSGATGRRLLTLPPRPQPGALFGYTLAGLGDVNGDGVPDLAVGAPGQDVRGLADLGQVFVFSVSTTP